MEKETWLIPRTVPIIVKPRNPVQHPAAAAKVAQAADGMAIQRGMPVQARKAIKTSKRLLVRTK
jgi:hypothetical protein